MHFLNVTSTAIYLPADIAQLPFGDPLSSISVTSASPGVITAPGYRNIANGQIVSFTTAGGSIPGGLTANTPYYVVNASGFTFSVAATPGGSAINTTSTGSNLTMHLLSQQIYGTRRPFKPGGQCLALNLGGTSLTLQGASDVNAGAPVSNPAPTGNPGGPGTYTTIATLAAGAGQLVTLNYDWISLTGSGTLVLIQN